MRNLLSYLSPSRYFKQMDLYIAKKFLSTFIVTILLFVIIIIVFDIAEKLDDFFGKSAPLKGIIFTYYANFIPSLINTFSPIFIFIAVLYFTSRLAQRSEFISMLAGGISLRRIMGSYVVVSALLALGSYYLNAWVIPRSDKKRVRFENQYLRDYWSQTKGTIYRQLKPGSILYMEYFNNNDSTGVGINLEQYNGLDMKSNIFGRFLKYNKENQKWRLEMVTIREFNADGSQNIKRLPFLDTALGFNPKDFFFRVEDVTSLDMNEMRTFIKNEKARGAQGIELLETELQRRYASPFSTFILAIIGVCVAGRKTRGGLGLNLAIGIFVIIFYLFFSKYFTSMGQTGSINPALAVWAPNIIFIPIAYIFYRFAQK